MRSRILKHSLLLSASFILCPGLTLGSPSALKGRVTDSEGAAIQGAHLLFHLDPSGKTKSGLEVDVMRDTDAQGAFNVQLEPGFYDVCVMATAFTPQCTKVLLSSQGIAHQDFHLSADPLVLKHIADTVY